MENMTRLSWILVILLLATRSAMSVPSCGKVINELAPCLSFLNGKDPSPDCCSGVKEMKSLAKTKADRVATCNCGKKVLSKMKYDPKRLPLLPKKCGVNINLPPIDKNFDCSKVSI